jgi:arsenite methyltransferase
MCYDEMQTTAVFSMENKGTPKHERDRIMKIWIAVFVLVLSQAFLVAQNRKLTMEEMHKLHQDSKAYISFLEDPQRDAYQKPHEVVMALGIREGEVIADIGAGSGYFTLRLAHHVGDTGRVYAVDVNPDMILYLNRRIRDTQLKNIITILAAPDDPLLMNKSIDRFFICDTWHHIQNKTQYLSLIKRMLKPGGQVIMIDFHKKELPVGAPMEMKIAREDLIQQMESNGFRLAKEHKFLPYQYFLIFTVKQ